MKPKLLCVFLMIVFASVRLSAMEWDGIWSDTVKTYELIESLSNIQSVINWTTGRVLTEMSVDVRYNDPNVGRQFHEYSTMMKDNLRAKLIEALGYLRIDGIFLLKDYYSRRDYIRYELIANVDNAFYYPPIVNRNRFYGAIALDLYGERGLANLFYRNINRAPLRKYVQPVSTGDTEYYDGLIVDTLLFKKFQPSVFFRIYDQDGVLLYGPETVDPSALRSRGVCLYTTELEYAFRSTRVGNNLFYIMPLATRGNMNTEIVIHNEDAARLFADPRTVEALNQSRVVVIKPQEREN